MPRQVLAGRLRAAGDDSQRSKDAAARRMAVQAKLKAGKKLSRGEAQALLADTRKAECAAIAQEIQRALRTLINAIDDCH